MESIDVSDLPEPVARAVEVMVQAFRKQLAREETKNGYPEQVEELPVWKGKPLGNLTREEIYRDVI